MKKDKRNGDGSTHGRKAANWSAPHQGPPGKVLSITKRCCREKICGCGFEADLNDLEKWIHDAEPWSPEKTHYMTLVAMIACDQKIPLQSRARASGMIRANIDDPIISKVST
tara:strand:+ start:203 stop:538 length:336 start_codon:yes stop_codon:yes gene_type:complete